MKVIAVSYMKMSVGIRKSTFHVKLKQSSFDAQ